MSVYIVLDPAYGSMAENDGTTSDDGDPCWDPELSDFCILRRMVTVAPSPSDGQQNSRMSCWNRYPGLSSVVASPSPHSFSPDVLW